MNLSLLILLPLLTALLILLSKTVAQIRVIGLAGSIVQLIASIGLLNFYMQQRATGNTNTYLFENNFILVKYLILSKIFRIFSKTPSI